MNIRYISVLALLLLLLVPLSAHSQSWRQLDTIPTAPADGLFSFSIGSTIYVGGAHRDFFAYDTLSGAWSKKAAIPGVTNSRAFPTGFAIGGKGYLAFGFDGSTKPGFIKNDIWEYDPASDTWTKKSDCPGVARDGAGVFVLGGKAYIGGGQDGSQVGLSDFYEYDPAADKWTQKADLAGGPVVFPSCFAIGSYGYFACGAVGFGETTHAWRYDPYSDSWTQRASFPGKPRQDALGFALGGLGYVGFGEEGFMTPFADFYSYDPAKDKWSLVTSAADTNARAWATATVVGNEVFLGTGWDMNLRFFNDWWELSLPVTPYQPTAHVSFNTALVDFGSVASGAELDTTVTIHSGPEKSVTISDVSLSGTTSSAFGIKNNPTLPLTLEPGKDYVLSISFKPGAEGSFDATLTMTSNAEGETAHATTLTLTGQGLKGATPHVKFSTDALSFGTLVPNENKSMPVTITADTTAALTISGVSITGPDSALFAITPVPALPLVVNPGGSLPLTIVFAPKAVGTFSASLAIVSNAEGDAAHVSKVSLTGAAASASVSPNGKLGDGTLTCLPNPFSDQLSIRWNGDEDVFALRIVDDLGREALDLGKQRLASGSTSILAHVKSLPPGHYWLVARGVKGIVELPVIKVE